MRELLYKELNHAARDPWRPTTVQELLDAACVDPGVPIALPQPKAWSVAPARWQQATAILAQIPALTVDVVGGVCCYSRPPESGVIARCDTARFERFVDDVIANPPQTMEDLLRLRPV